MSNEETAAKRSKQEERRGEGRAADPVRRRRRRKEWRRNAEMGGTGVWMDARKEGRGVQEVVLGVPEYVPHYS